MAIYGSNGSLHMEVPSVLEGSGSNKIANIWTFYLSSLSARK